jgi:hypothetical protein
MIGTATKKNARRKHRLYIDVTYSSPVARRDAAKGLQMVLNERLDLQAKPVWAYDNTPYIDKVNITERGSQK